MTERPTNRLVHETSPYLLQHAHNPVDWYPWGPEALERAKAEDKPIFLSIGYSACHWCHVMERESFEDPAVAAVMNEHFVCIKVDREERPDVDELYMKAVQAMTGGGGWPMSVWLLPDGRPFYGGTYFPPDDRFGRPGFVGICQRLAQWYATDRAGAERQAALLHSRIVEAVQPFGEARPVPEGQGVVERAVEQILATFDARSGGFGGAPKFPHPMDLSLLLRAGHGDTVRRCLEVTLEKMARGGLYDQLGGGFHRYSVDARWAVPHFEKMLYDNALLAEVYLDGSLVLGREEFRTVCVETLDYLLREMTDEHGAFTSSQDADSEGEEGRFFVWDPAEIAAVVGAEDAEWVCAYFGVDARGNFEHGKTVLYRPLGDEEFAKAHGLSLTDLRRDVARVRAALFAARRQRVAPARDDKVLLDWNGLAISAFARAGFHLGESRFLDAARRAASFALETLRDAEGRSLRTAKHGVARGRANLGDLGALIAGLLELYQATFETRWLAAALELQEEVETHFADREAGGYFFTPVDGEVLIARSKEAYDGATPSAPSLVVGNLVRLFEFTGEPALRTRAERTLSLYAAQLEQAPRASSRMVEALWFLRVGAREVVLVGEDRAQLEVFLPVLRSRLAPARIVLGVWPEVAATLEGIAPVVEGKEILAGKPQAYVCRDFSCEAPVDGPDALAELLERD